MNELSTTNEMRYALEQVRTIGDAKELRDRAEAARKYCQQAQLGLKKQNHCAEVKIRAERKAGELLRELGEQGVRYSGQGGNRRSRDAVSLEKLDVSRKQSSRWQQVASLDEVEFEEHIRKVCETPGLELTTASVLKLAKRRQAPPKERTSMEPPADCRVIEDLDSLVATGPKFACLLVDPPWGDTDEAPRAVVADHYPTVTVQQLAALPVRGMAAEHAHLHLWTQTRFLREGLALIRHWGFSYCAQLVWVKPDATEFSNYYQVSHELLLLGVRGDLRFQKRNVRSWFEHEQLLPSQKPAAFREMIERVSPGPRIELFARDPGAGWWAWGRQISQPPGAASQHVAD